MASSVVCCWLVLFPLLFILHWSRGCCGFNRLNYTGRSRETNIFMDRSSANVFQLGDEVTVVEDVVKAGSSLKGMSGVVVETWEKCDVDPTCCCAELVDEGLSVHVKFYSPVPPFSCDGNEFIHYFSESELISKES